MTQPDQTQTSEPLTLGQKLGLVFTVVVLIVIAFLMAVLTVVVGCGQKYPSVNHTLTYSNAPQTALSCLQTSARDQGQRCLAAHPEERKTFGPNGVDKDMGDCLYNYPEVGFKKAGFYLPENQTPVSD